MAVFGFAARLMVPSTLCQAVEAVADEAKGSEGWLAGGGESNRGRLEDESNWMRQSQMPLLSGRVCTRVISRARARARAQQKHVHVCSCRQVARIDRSQRLLLCMASGRRLSCRARRSYLQ